MLLGVSQMRVQGPCKQNAEGLARQPEGESQSSLFAGVKPVLEQRCKVTTLFRALQILPIYQINSSLRVWHTFCYNSVRCIKKR